LIITEIKATKSHRQTFSKGPLNLPKAGSLVGMWTLITIWK